MEEIFEIICATVIGRDHKIAGKNNQDAIFIRKEKDLIVALVADGCSEGKNSEVGAKLGIKILGEQISRMLHGAMIWIDPALVIELAKQNTLRILERILNDLGDNTNRNVLDHFLFTVIGLIATCEEALVFGLGDGFASINGEVIDIPKYENNEPQYIGYDLMHNKPNGIKYDLKIFKRIPKDRLETAMIGTDGALDLIEIADKTIPGKNELIGSLDQYLEDKFFRNPDMLRRRFAMINRDAIRINDLDRENIRENGHLPDDTTMIVLRRKEKENGNLFEGKTPPP